MPENQPYYGQGGFYLWREWYLTPDPTAKPDAAEITPATVRLRSTLFGQAYIWDNVVNQAACAAEDKKAHEGTDDAPGDPRVPAQHCTCGLYGFASLEDLLINTFGGYTATKVSGVMQCWGNIVLAQYGARAEYARPVALFIHPDYIQGREERYLESLTEYYRCEVRVERAADLYERLVKEGLENAPYPAISPLVDLKGMRIPEAEMDPAALDWDSIKAEQERRNFRR